MTLLTNWRGGTAALALTLGLPAAGLANTSEPAQLAGIGSWTTSPVVTVGETVGAYTPVGIPDGLGAMMKDGQTVRIFSNHELGNNRGYAYTLANATSLIGARVSYLDINKTTRQIQAMGPAYDTIYDRYGVIVTNGSQINETAAPTVNGIDRLCSAWMGLAGYYGLVDNVFFTGEESGDGQEFCLDPATNTLWCAPALGRAAWESVTMLTPPAPNQVAVVIGDDRTGAPLLLYIGDKNGVGDGSFLDRNGLKMGKLYVWTADLGDLTPATFNGTGSARVGTFKEIAYFNAALAGTPGYDNQGYAGQATQDVLGDALGAFSFSRPEDLATNPSNGRQITLASTGQGATFPADNWGDLYVIDFDFTGVNPKATVRILYDGDDAGAGQFAGPDFGLRSPDNLDWAADGNIYVQEDRSTTPGSLFGGTSLEEASIWKANPVSGMLTRVARIDRTAVPTGQIDGAPADRGNWESSGIIDVTSFFDVLPNETLFFLDTEAHSLGGPPIGGSAQLVEGGQWLFLSHIDDPVAVTLASFTAQRGSEGAVVAWEVANAVDHAGFHVYRQTEGAERIQVSTQLLSGRNRYEFVDGSAPTGPVSYWLAEINRAGETAWHGPISLQSGIGVVTPPTLTAAPTPFSAATSIRFTLSRDQRVALDVFDLNGRRVRSLTAGVLAAGEHTIGWNGDTDSGDRSSAGIYFIRLNTGGENVIQKVVLSR